MPLGRSRQLSRFAAAAALLLPFEARAGGGDAGGVFVMVAAMLLLAGTAALDLLVLAPWFAVARARHRRNPGLVFRMLAGLSLLGQGLVALVALSMLGQFDGEQGALTLLGLALGLPLVMGLKLVAIFQGRSVSPPPEGG